MIEKCQAKGERTMSDEKTASDYMLEIAAHYLMNGCDNCPFYDITKTCNSVPINCTWIALISYFKAEEVKEEKDE